MRQRLRRPLRYGSSLKRGSLAATLNKMPGPSSALARPHPSSLMAQSTTVNITWPPEENGNGTGSFVLQVCLDGQQQQQQHQLSPPTDTPPQSTADLEKMSNPSTAEGNSAAVPITSANDSLSIFFLLTSLKNWTVTFSDRRPFCCTRRSKPVAVAGPLLPQRLPCLRHRIVYKVTMSTVSLHKHAQFISFVHKSSRMDVYPATQHTRKEWSGICIC